MKRANFLLKTVLFFPIFLVLSACVVDDDDSDICLSAIAIERDVPLDESVRANGTVLFSTSLIGDTIILTSNASDLNWTAYTDCSSNVLSGELLTCDDVAGAGTEECITANFTDGWILVRELDGMDDTFNIEYRFP